MKLCIAGRNNICVNVIKYCISNFGSDSIIVIPSLEDTGIDSYQRSVLKFAKINNLLIEKIESIYDQSEIIFLSIEYDRIINIGNFQSTKLYNLHFSLLPQYKGVFTAFWPIRNMDKFSGVTLHKIDNGIDTGDIIDQIQFKIPLKSTSKDLFELHNSFGFEIIKKNIQSLIDGNYKSFPQSFEYSSYYSRNSFQFNNNQININQTAFNVESQIKSLRFREFQMPNFNNMNISHMIITQNRSSKKPGTIIKKNKLSNIVSTIDFDIEIFFDQFEDMLFASKTGNIELFYTYLKNGYNLDEQNEKGWTPLIVSSYNGQIQIVDFLLKNNVLINKPNFNGTTPLMYAKDFAFRNSNFDVVEILLKNGADINLQDYSGKNIFDYIEKEFGIIEMQKFKTLFKKYSI